MCVCVCVLVTWSGQRRRPSRNVVVAAVCSRVVIGGGAGAGARAGVCACGNWLLCSPADTASFNYKTCARSDLTSFVVSFISVRC